MMSDDDAAARPAASGASDPHKPDAVSPQQSARSIIGTVAAVGSLGLAVLAGLMFVLLSMATALAFEPLGVRPSELGLGSTTLLEQAAVAVIVVLLVWVLLGAVGVVLRSTVDREEVKELGEHRWTFEIALAVVGVICFTVVVFWDAYDARVEMAEGRKPTTLFGIAPWSAEVANLSWANGQASHAYRLPRCALYLGQSGGTSVVYDGETKRTWRIPSSDLDVRALPTRTKCP